MQKSHTAYAMPPDKRVKELKSLREGTYCGSKALVTIAFFPTNN